MNIVNRKSEIVNGSWLPDMDLNHDKVIQSHLCYRYTIGQAGAFGKLKSFAPQSRRQTSVPKGRKIIAHGFNRGWALKEHPQPRRGGRNFGEIVCRPYGTRFIFNVYPRLKPWAIIGRSSGATT
jgi:hypothetical protein